MTSKPNLTTAFGLLLKEPTHFPDHILIDFIEGTLPPEQQNHIRDHLPTCPACTHEVHSLQASLAEIEADPTTTDRMWSRLQTAIASEAATSPSIAPTFQGIRGGPIKPTRITARPAAHEHHLALAALEEPQVPERISFEQADLGLRGHAGPSPADLNGASRLSLISDGEPTASIRAVWPGGASSFHPFAFYEKLKTWDTSIHVPMPWPQFAKFVDAGEVIIEHQPQS